MSYLLPDSNMVTSIQVVCVCVCNTDMYRYAGTPCVAFPTYFLRIEVCGIPALAGQRQHVLAKKCFQLRRVYCL